MRVSKHTGLAAALLLMFCVSGWADTISLTLTDDAYIHGLRPTSVYGLQDDFFVTSYGPKQGLVRFDAASIAGLEINSATLNLYLNDIERAGTISIHAVTSSWNESTVTWDNQPPAEISATAVVSLAPADEEAVVSIDVTEVVERWADGSLADGGFLIVTADSIKAYFDAQEKTGGTPATLEVDTGPPAYSGEAIVLDLSEPDNCIIDEPGYYVLDRSWLLSEGGTGDAEPNASCGPVHITSGGVVLDLRGFEIWTGYEWGSYEPVLWIDTEYGVTLRNGGFTGVFVAIEASVASDRYGVTLDNIRAGSVLLRDRLVTVTGGSFSGGNEPALWIGAGSRVERARFSCIGGEGCIYGGGSSLIRDCTFDAENPYGAPAIIVGDDSIIAGNILDGWIGVGNRNLVARNFSSGGDPYIEVSGTGNILDGNIGPGIVFKTPGNFYGNNRVALPSGFAGTDGNVDWGGNVTF